MRPSHPSFIPALAAAVLAVGASVFTAAVFVAPGYTVASPSEAAAFGGFDDECGAGGSRSVSVEGRRGRYDVSIRQGRCRLEIEMRGDIEFLDDESAVASMSSRARLEIDEKVGGSSKRLVVTPGAGGKPVYAWTVDGRQIELDDDGRAWMRRRLPEIFRATGIDAEARVGRLLGSGGVPAVLSEIPLLGGDYTQRTYLDELLEQAELGHDELARLVEVAGREIGSDFELAQLLVAAAASIRGDDPLPRSFAAAIEEIGSDYEHARVLKTILEHRDLSAEGLDELLATATGIGSDFELGRVLVQATEMRPRDRALPPSFFAAVDTVGSDFEQRRVLDAVVRHRSLTPQLVRQLLDASSSLGSDFEMAEFLVALVRAYPIDDQLRPDFARALDSVGSSHEKQRVRVALERSGRS